MREWLLLTKALLCTVSVVKANFVQDRAATSQLCAKGDKCFCDYQRAFLENQFVTFLFDCKLWIYNTAKSEN